MASAIGCGEPSASFTTSERTADLIKEARRGVEIEVDGEEVDVNGVEGYLTENFGTPHDLVAWLRLPVEFGGQAGTVVASEGEAGPSKKLKVEVENGTNLETATLAWLSGDFAGETVAVTSFDAEAGIVTLAEKLEVPAGTSFILNAGQTLADGRRHYMTHCSHCHGTTGDGNGPTAEYMYPRPRDYRKGIFKFTRTKASEKVITSDLIRIVKKGIPGTYMPSFALLEDDELLPIIQYVRFLSMRGEYENKLCVELEEGYSTKAFKSRTSEDGGESEDEVMAELEAFLVEEMPTLADEAGTSLQEAWDRAEAEESLIVPTVARTTDSPESRHRGRNLFLSAKAKCTNCHGPNGLGNGPQTEDYEKDPGSGEVKPLPGLYDEWGQIVKPRNLTTGIYRGGRRPIDLFSRIHAGIKGAKMPAFGGGVLKDEEIWDIVNYVLSVPHADSSPAEPETTPAAAVTTKDDTTPDTNAVAESKVAASTEDAGE